MTALTRIHAGASVRPQSAVGHGVGAAGLAGLATWLVVARVQGLDGPSSALVACAATALPMILWSLLVERVHERPSTGLDLALRRPWRATLDLTATKLAGLWATWAAIAAAYWIGRWYWSGGYPWAMGVLTAALPWLVAGSVPYLLWIDRRMVSPCDGCWQAGAALTGRWGEVDRAALANHARGWAVKGFFLAFMLSILPGGFRVLVATSLAEMLARPTVLIGTLIAGMFVVDVMVATAGYVLTFRPLDAHIRSAEPTVAGWVAALACYPPFALMQANGTYAGPLHYNAGSLAAEDSWAVWLSGSPLFWVVGGALVALTAFYAWATVAFGLRFSNLTHRGILTHGPYALTRHPAYLSKNAFWWLGTLPFLAPAWQDAVRNTVLLVVVSAIYYWRARTEQAHLGRDPDYRRYSRWAEDNAWWPRLTRGLPWRGSAATPSARPAAGAWPP